MAETLRTLTKNTMSKGGDMDILKYAMKMGKATFEENIDVFKRDKSPLCEREFDIERLRALIETFESSN